MVNNGHTRPSDRESQEKSSVIYENSRRFNHWSQTVKKVVIRTFADCDKCIVIGGGSDNGEFVYIEHVRNDQIAYVSDRVFENDDVVLTIQEQKVSGFTYLDAVNWLKHCAKSSALVAVECIPRGYLSLGLADFLNHRFRKGSLDHELQNTIRDNLYIRTVPVTTRPPKEFEINGIDYVFLTINEFNKLKLNGTLLESGIYEGNYYGTPKPLRNNYLAVNDKPSFENVTESYLPGIHPSSEGKRKRNRSNVEAMAAKDLDHSSIISNGLNSKDHYSDNMQRKNPPNYYYENSLKYSDQLDEDELGPLPPKWEKAYTENGEVYFIDHNSSTSHWLDPRLSRIQKKSLEDCSEDELPFGWERIDDPLYGTYYIDHVNRQTQYENPVIQAKYANSCNNMNNCSNLSEKNNRSDNYSHDNAYNSYMNNSKYNDGISENAFFTANPDELVGERIHSTLVKSYKGLGFTIIGGDDNKEFLQIKSIVTNGPAWYEGKLQTGDVLVYVNNKCVLGYTHHDMVTVFQSIAPGETVEIEVCRGYPLPFDPNDPNTKVVTTMAVSNNDNNPNLGSFVDQDAYLKRHILDADSNDATNSSVKSLPDLYLPEKALHVPRPTSTDLILQDDDKPEILTMSIVKGSEGFGFTIADSAYGQKVKKIIDKQRCENLQEGDILAEINNISVRKMCHSDVVQVLKDCTSNKAATISVERMNFSKNKLRNKKDDLKMAMYRTKTPTENCPLLMEAQNGQKLPDCSNNNMKRAAEMYGMENYNMQACYSRSQSPGNELDQNDSWNRKRSPEMYKHAENNYMSMVSRNNNYYAGSNDYGINSRSSSDVNDNYFYSLANNQRKESTSFEHEQPLSTNGDARLYRRDIPGAVKMYGQDSDYYETVVTIERQETGFGFRIVGGTEEGSQVSIGHIVEGGAAEVDGRLRSGDEIMSVDNQSVMNSSHHHVVQLMGKAAASGRVTLGIRRRIPSKNHTNAMMRPEIRYPYDVTVTRRENEGFGFVIISSLNKAGSAIGRIIEGSPAERSGLLHVGDHILAVNGINIMNLHHGDIVNLIKDSGYSVTLTIGMPIDEPAGSIVSNSTSHRDDLYDGQYHVIEISRGSRGFGFSIRGGREFQNMALYVLQIAENGPAALDGRLKVGDRLVEINGINTKNMTHAQAIEIIRNGGPTVMLLVQRGGKVPSLPSEESPTQHRNAMMCSPSEPRPVGMMNGRSESWDTQLSSS
ncbi:membrane-associated guanylate kinase, WW and PDZ domain-containing protein 2 isoform X2 [Planococcus citri]|uniref:membrane-associated guanylate kinase, WW and PDZ domain-containing protein 2 isoform X2 n=1 Tax=Planococcus citri TaxID=170843 RepID=UPI0031FA3AFF